MIQSRLFENLIKYFKAYAGRMNSLFKAFKSLAISSWQSVGSTNFLKNEIISSTPLRFCHLLKKLHERNIKFEQGLLKKKQKKRPLNGNPFAKGLILKTVIKKPRKPNSANRKCVLVKLTTGKEMVAYVPKEGHNLQEHQVVLCQVGRVRDLPGVKIRCVRGKYDLPHVVKATKV